ncbi:hypothetical protein L208DRAFT_541926 [Tricholoma matsutake]|nr:hypothetical protein L208DRAFT_541926 [Tricholoma matsutake 945]
MLDVFGTHSPPKAGPRKYPRMDPQTPTPWTSFPNDPYHTRQLASYIFCPQEAASDKNCGDRRRSLCTQHTLRRLRELVD